MGLRELGLNLQFTLWVHALLYMNLNFSMCTQVQYLQRCCQGD